VVQLAYNLGAILTYDADHGAQQSIPAGKNRLTNVTGTTSATSAFIYDGDGNRVKSTMGTTTTGFVGDHTEWKVGAANQPTRYYNAGGTRLATRLDGVMYYPLTDHLGSTTMTTDASGNQVAEIRYKAWGESRYTYGTPPTKHTYTGQYSNVSDFGLMYYNARWYDSALGRFTSADTIVPQPGNPQDWDRYGYTRNSPENFSDPSGHRPCEGDLNECLSESSFERFSSINRKVSSDWGNSACTGSNQSILCRPQATEQQIIPGIFPQSNIPSSESAHEGFSDPDLDALLLFWDKVADPFFKSEEAYWIYQVTSKGGYKTIKWSLPLGPIEAAVAGVRQGYFDSWTKNFSLIQRGSRIGIVAIEAYATDWAATTAGYGGALLVSPSGPIGSASGYGIAANLVTNAGERFWQHTVNPWLFDILNLGVYP
jgi:RHS repeat-associated protein